MAQDPRQLPCVQKQGVAGVQVAAGKALEVQRGQSHSEASAAVSQSRYEDDRHGRNEGNGGRGGVSAPG